MAAEDSVNPKPTTTDNPDGPKNRRIDHACLQAEPMAGMLAALERFGQYLPTMVMPREDSGCRPLGPSIQRFIAAYSFGNFSTLPSLFSSLSSIVTGLEPFLL